MEFKTITFDVKSADLDNGERIIEGFASTYDLDTGDDRITPGAFMETIAERFSIPRAKNGKSKIKALWQHNTEDLIGRILVLEEREEGLYTKIKLFNDPIFVSAEKAYKLAKMGELDSFSIGFKPVEWYYECDQEGNETCRVITKVKLYELSVVTFPMNEKAEFTSVKRGGDVMNEQIIELLKEIKNMLEVKSVVTSEVIETVASFEETAPFELEAVKEAAEAVTVIEEVAIVEEVIEEVVEEKAANCKGCGKPKKMMCPECGEDEEEEENSKNASLELSTTVAALEEKLSHVLTAEEVKSLVISTVEEILQKNNKKSEVNLEDFISSMLTKDFTL